MIRFNNLSINASGQLLIDAQVKGDSYFDNVYIDKVIIDTQKTFLTGGPSETPVYTYTFDEEVNAKEVNLVLDSSDMLVNIKHDLLFIYIVTKGAPSMDTPCGMDNYITLGIAYYQQTILGTFLNYMKEIENNCAVPKHFIDYYLRIKAFELSIDTGNYTQAIIYWNKFFINNTTISSNSNCGCNGTYR